MEEIAISISMENIGKLPPIYQKELQKMIPEFNGAQSNLEKLRILREFSGKFLCILDLWEIQMKLEQILVSQNISFSGDSNDHLRKNLCFFSEKYGNCKKLKWNNLSEFWKNYLFEKPWDPLINEPEKVLTFPHRDLIDGYIIYETSCVKPIQKETKPKYEKSFFLWKEFVKNDELTNAKFLEYLNEIDDEEVVIGVIEHRLSWKMGCLDKKLWEFYKEYMKSRCQIGLLNVHRKYTRFFIEDKSAVKEYRKEIERISKIPMAVSEFWIDIILYELDFGSHESAANLMEEISGAVSENQSLKEFSFFDGPNLIPEEFIEILRNFDRNLSILSPPQPKISIKIQPRIQCYYPINQKSTWKKTQNFYLPRPTILYLTKAANYKTLQKLFTLCKFFFAIQPTPLCHRLVLGCSEPSQYIEQSLFLNQKDLNFPGLLNLHVTTILDAIFNDDELSWDYGRALGNAIAKISKSSAQFGTILHQELSLDEFKFLYPYGEIDFGGTFVYNEDVSCFFFPGELRDHWEKEEKLIKSDNLI